MLDDPTKGLINDAGGDIFERLIEVLLGVLLAFMPLAMGVVQAWSEQVVFILVAVLCLLTLIRWVLLPQQRLVLSWLYVPLTMALSLVVFQLIPLSAEVLTRLSPHTVALKTQYLGDLPQAESLLAKMCLTFYPQSRRRSWSVPWG